MKSPDLYNLVPFLGANFMEKNLQQLHPFLAPFRNLWILTQALQGMHLHFDLEIGCVKHQATKVSPRYSKSTKQMTQEFPQ